MKSQLASSGSWIGVMNQQQVNRQNNRLMPRIEQIAPDSRLNSYTGCVSF